MPRDVAATRPWAAEVKSAAGARDVEPSGGRRFLSAHQATPATHLLSNGRYATMLTSAGSGYSRWGDLALTRWREDATCDDFGSYLFVKDVRSGVGVVGGLPTERRRAGRLCRGLQRGPRRSDAPRRLADDDVGRARFGRGRRGSSPRLDHEFRRPYARNRNHVLRRTRSGAAERRHRPSRLLETVRRDGISRRRRRDPGDAATAGADRAGNLGRASDASSTARRSALPNSKPTEPGSSAAAAAFARPSP